MLYGFGISLELSRPELWDIRLRKNNLSPALQRSVEDRRPR